jgi:hypothetical protein
MAKSIDSAFAKLQALKNAASKFSPSVGEGNRIIPSPSKDEQISVRIDAGHYDPETNALNVVLQVNAQAKSPGLTDWLKKNSTHGKLATATFNTKAEDKQAETLRVFEELKRQAKENLK